jgi:hypothetical protein
MKTLAVTVAVVALVLTSAIAWSAGGGVGGRSFSGLGVGGHEGREHSDHLGHRFRRFSSGFVFVQPTPNAYDASPNCGWQEGYWGPNQPFIDEYGFERFAPVWIPGQWDCS